MNKARSASNRTFSWWSKNIFITPLGALSGLGWRHTHEEKTDAYLAFLYLEFFEHLNLRNVWCLSSKISEMQGYSPITLTVDVHKMVQKWGEKYVSLINKQHLRTYAFSYMMQSLQEIVSLVISENGTVPPTYFEHSFPSPLISNPLHFCSNLLFFVHII